MKKGKVKLVDDLSCMAALHLPSSLVPDTRPDTPRPVPYRGRHGLRLPEEQNELQSELDYLSVYAENHLILLANRIYQHRLKTEASYNIWPATQEN